MNILDFGCGLGRLTRLLAESFPKTKVTGYDISFESLKEAREQKIDLCNLRFVEHLPTSESQHIIIVANVFHHTLPQERTSILSKLKSIMKPEGRMVVFEHNPLNPLSRRVVKNCPYDADAQMVWPELFKKTVERCGLKVIHKGYIVFFPRFLKFLRGIEQYLGFLPFGAQYFFILTDKTLPRGQGFIR
ncbi:class I SAM-dependent methyltransferase [Thermodesulfobacteriota bacterium]